MKHKLAQTSGDFRAAHAFLRAEGVEVERSLSFPTVLAIEENDDGEEIVGLISTSIQHGMIVAGPLVVRQSDRSRRWVLLRLVEAYDTLLFNMGIEAYVFGVDTDNEHWLSMIKRVFGEPRDATEGQVVFIRKLGNDQQERQRTGTFG